MMCTLSFQTIENRVFKRFFHLDFVLVLASMPHTHTFKFTWIRDNMVYALAAARRMNSTTPYGFTEIREVSFRRAAHPLPATPWHAR
eukprot:scaffold90226_cov60-Phaeocystis_antarctica.AAC.1